ncbi:MAG: hypothetical protein PHH45_00600 [Patescibacteria group bacterium]|jgi:hypothetical protein|nr:hypothetical protein [Patescibacteria group bacterium]HPL01724.1 hypothetical protein [bacterium]
MKSEIWQPFFDRNNLVLIISAFISSGVVFALYFKVFSAENGMVMISSFTPVHIFVMVLFAVNLALGLISFRRDRHLSYIFNGLTIVCCILLLLALVLKIISPNG